jgi:hypothetical protein
MNEILNCPICSISIQITAINCNKFVCGVYKNDMNQVNSHLSEKECKELGNTIYGCGTALTLHNGVLIKTAWG